MNGQNKAFDDEIFLDIKVAESSRLYKFYGNPEKNILGAFAVVVFPTPVGVQGDVLSV